MNTTTLWLAFKLLFHKDRKILSTTGWVSLAGLVLGVASLVVSMAVISGFDSTLMKSVSDVAGHLQIFKLNTEPESWESLFEKLKKYEPQVLAANRFVMVEAVLAHKGKINGVFLQGVDEQQVGKVLGLQERIKEGAFQLTSTEEAPAVLLGKGLAKDFGLQVGDVFKLIVPQSSDLEVTQFHRRISSFKVAGILDLGKYEYDQRWIFSTLLTAQRFADIGSHYSGVQLKVSHPLQAREAGFRLSQALGPDYRVRDWKDINENLFEAVKIEKVVIFFVIFIIVIAAAFNVASSLYINVIRSYGDIAILKAMGLTRRKLIQLFSFQGLLLGGLGCLMGLGLGLLFCFGFYFLQRQFSLIQSGVYKIDFIYVQLRFTDLAAIVAATLLICLVATLAPAIRGARLTTVEGLKHE
jgi:lipoprotein-releasing system permease protein